MSLSQIKATSQHHSPEAAYVLGVRVDRLSQRQALDSIEQIIVQWRASDRAQVCQQIVTVNPEFVMEAQHNKDFRTAIDAAALIVADGVGVVWATRYLGRPVPERVTGTDLLPELAQPVPRQAIAYTCSAPRQVLRKPRARVCKSWPLGW